MSAYPSAPIPCSLLIFIVRCLVRFSYSLAN